MPVRTAYAGAAVSGEVLTAANVNKLPGGWIGYAEVTANQTGITAVTDLTGLSVAVTVGTSRRLRVTGFIHIGNVAGSSISFAIKEGATTLQDAVANSVAGAVWTMAVHTVLTPTAGAHTYKLTLAGSSATDMLAATTYPAFILVEDIGPAT